MYKNQDIIKDISELDARYNELWKAQEDPYETGNTDEMNAIQIQLSLLKQQIDVEDVVEFNKNLKKPDKETLKVGDKFLAGLLITICVIQTMERLR
jgi:hypothetical protein